MSFILYAPNVHTGGGSVLLKALLASLPAGEDTHLMLDARAQSQLQIPAQCSVQWFYSTPSSRWQAERQLRARSTTETTVLCFHGLPPLLSNRGKILVFQQNRNYFDYPPLSTFALRTAVRVGLERVISRQLRHRVDRYLVQTPSMKRALVQWYGRGTTKTPQVDILPFVETPPDLPQLDCEWDFIYVADGEAHKNHTRLLDAWCLLAKEGIKPSLALTLSPRDQHLHEQITVLRDREGINVRNLGQMPHGDIFRLYRRARALVFPSLSESFGLPLIEAAHYGLPIIASELDFVRDVCAPVHSFDPMSSVSIARAIKRFMNVTEIPQSMLSAGEFWKRMHTL